MNHLYESPLGPLQLVFSGDQLTALKFASTSDAPPTDAPHSDHASLDHPAVRLVTSWLDRYFSGQRPDPTEIPLQLDNTPYRMAVWQRLLQIPFGQTMTYGELADEIAQNMDRRACARAIGGALRANPICIIVPCHRVIEAGGRPGGYAGGPGNKIRLLLHEGVLRLSPM